MDGGDPCEKNMRCSGRMPKGTGPSPAEAETGRSLGLADGITYSTWRVMGQCETLSKSKEEQPLRMTPKVDLRSSDTCAHTYRNTDLSKTGERI